MSLRFKATTLTDCIRKAGGRVARCSEAKLCLSLWAQYHDDLVTLEHWGVGVLPSSITTFSNFLVEVRWPMTCRTRSGDTDAYRYPARRPSRCRRGRRYQSLVDAGVATNGQSLGVSPVGWYQAVKGQEPPHLQLRNTSCQRLAEARPALGEL